MIRKTTIISSIFILLIIVGAVFLYIQKNKDTNVFHILQNISNNTITEEQNNNSNITYNKDKSIDTSNWKTYRNEEYGFEVKYPENTSYEEVLVKNNLPNVTRTEHFYIYFSRRRENMNSHNSIVYVSVFDLPRKNINFQELLLAKDDTNVHLLRQYFFKDTIQKNINGQEFFISEMMPSSLDSVTIKNGKYYQITNRDDFAVTDISNEDKAIYFETLNSFRTF